MTSDEVLRDSDLIVERYFPYDGPHTPQSVAAAADVVAGLVRYLNNATSPGNDAASLPYAVSVYQVLNRLSIAVHGLPQLLDQLLTAIVVQGGSPTLYDDRHDRHATDTANELIARLSHALDSARTLGSDLNGALSAGVHLGNRVED